MDEIKEEFCDNYCKFPGEYKDPDEMYNAVCCNCILDSLEVDDAAKE